MQELQEKELVMIDGKNTATYTTSLIVSEYFGKEHKNVIRDIENLDCSKEFCRLNFELAKYTDKQSKKRKYYKIKKDGLVFLIMGYRGDIASELKEKYIKQFNFMQHKLEKMSTPEFQQLRLTAKTSTETLHETINDKFIPYAIENGSKTYKNKPELAYTHFEKPINKSLGIAGKQRCYLDKKGQTILDLMNNSIICVIDELIEKGIDYHDIVSTSKDKIKQINNIFKFSV